MIFSLFFLTNIDIVSYVHHVVTLAPDVGDLGGGVSFDSCSGGGEGGGDDPEASAGPLPAATTQKSCITIRAVTLQSSGSASACVRFIFGIPGRLSPLTTRQRQLGCVPTTRANFEQHVAVGVEEFPVTKSTHGAIIISTLLQSGSANVRPHSTVTVTIAIARPGSRILWYMGTGLCGL
ncbi:hypothetical protein F3Y22_tig00011718pilonHSYRG00064 [Hibiscus syriacus]|uniref:Uncharacterized protein n=1 Tax=Hibiscus syriacus TaxID=106335 RepID=A0A6A3C3P0_HIBSY|nr:hypothetical protein F3Y22_tig00011718pilonHSYRG00064 [Hibiscus syriacus]